MRSLLTCIGVISCDHLFLAQWYPQVPLKVETVVSLEPDWATVGSPTTMIVHTDSRFTQNIPIESIFVHVQGPTNSYMIEQELNPNNPFSFELPALQEAGEHCMTVDAWIAPINGRTREAVRFVDGNNCFPVIPTITQVSAVSGSQGPPLGGTTLTFEIMMDQPWPSPGSPVYDLDCVFETYNTPIDYSFPADPSSAISATCVTPTTLTGNFDLCVNIVPRNKQTLLYSIYQDPTTFTCSGITIPFNFYPNVPAPNGFALSPQYINYDGISDPVVVLISFPPSPQSMGSILCRYGSEVSTAIVVAGTFNDTTSTVSCDGAPEGDLAQLDIDPVTRYLIASVYVSFNDGLDYSTQYAQAYYNTEFYIDFVDPPVIPYSGGTPVRYYIRYSGQRINATTNLMSRPELFTSPPAVVCLFKDLQSNAVTIPIDLDVSGDYMLGSSLTVEQAFDVIDRSFIVGGPDLLVTVSFFLPGTTDCQDPAEDGVPLTYRPEWQGSSVSPSVFTVNPPTTSAAVFNIVGTNFYTDNTSVCRIRPILPPGSASSAAYTDGTCDLIGQFNLVASDGTAGTCTITGKQTLFPCTYSAIQAASQSAPSETLVEYQSLLLEISVANNGRDFIPVSQIDTVSGSSAPILISAIRTPIIEKIVPNFGFTFGGYSIEVQLRSGVAWDVTKCVFIETSSGITKTVDANIFTLRSVGCVVPQWRLLDSVVSTTFTVSLQISSTEFTAPATLTMYEFPFIESAFPRVGPIGGGTEISIVADPASLAFFLNQQPLNAAPIPTPLTIQCAFESLVLVPALYDPDTGNLACVAPPASKVGLGAGGYATVELNVNWLQMSDDSTTVDDRLRSQSGSSVYQFVFGYQSVQFDVSSMGPLSGPTAGGTLVIIETDTTVIPNSGTVYCLFGRISVQAQWRDPHTIWCLSPQVSNVGIVTLRISIDGGQSTSPFLFTAAIGNATIGSTGLSSYFNYYNPPTVSILTPSSGSSLGGTNVIVHGNNFSGSRFDNPKCRFGTVVVDVGLFMSSKILVCTSPPGSIGRVPISVSNNGVDFPPITDSSSFFTYTELEAILEMTPILGPITGGTVVTISARSGVMPSASSEGYVFSSGDPPRCEFGGYSVSATIIDATTGDLQCITPAVPSATTLNVIIYFNSQLAGYVAAEFLFYNVPSITSIIPPLGPEGVPNTLTLIGQNFVNSESLMVRFGTINVGYEDVPGLFVSSTEIRVSAPITSPSAITRRLPVMISNNGVDFVPSAIEQWDPNDESLSNIVKYYTLHIPIALRYVYPPFADMRGGGYVSVYGGPFINTGGLGACGFDSVVASSTIIFIAPDHILCPVPNMWLAGSPSAISRETKLRVSLVGNFFSNQYLTFRFISSAPPGAYLPHTSPTVFTSQTAQCLAGHSCEIGGLYEPIQCPPGTYQPYPNQKGCLPCPVGFYCSVARSNEPIVCDAGWVCDSVGLISPSKLCPPGFVCLAGTATTDPVPNEPFNALTPSTNAYGTNGAYRCPLGMYCSGGVVAFVSKPGNYSTPQPCYPGAFCSPGSTSPYGSGLIPLGRYSATPKNPGTNCPPRFYCGPVTGSVHPIACPAGTFNGLIGQHNCTLAPEGTVAPSPMLSRPIPSPCGTVSGRKGMVAVSANDLCPAGMTCDYGVASDAEPPICFHITTTNMTEINTLCQSVFGQVYIAGSPSATSWKRVDTTKGHCCWKPEKVYALAQRIVNIFKSSYYDNPLLVRSAQGFSEALLAITSPEINGLTLLESVDKSTLISDYKVNIGKVRDRILYEIERHYSFKRPNPCAAGTFCGPGTCDAYPTVLTQN